MATDAWRVRLGNLPGLSVDDEALIAARLLSEAKKPEEYFSTSFDDGVLAAILKHTFLHPPAPEEEPPSKKAKISPDEDWINRIEFEDFKEVIKALTRFFINRNRVIHKVVHIHRLIHMNPVEVRYCRSHFPCFPPSPWPPSRKRLSVDLGFRHNQMDPKKTFTFSYYKIYFLTHAA